jgi:hypothetical protein
MSSALRLRIQRPAARWSRLIVLLTGLLALTPVAAVTSGRPAVAQTQSGMDLGILSPSFRDLPYSVQPGQELTITAQTANGARCAGWIVFRNQPPMALESQPAPAAVCSWTVTVPPTARAGTANIGIEITRSGQSWALYGITYVSPVGEQR